MIDSTSLAALWLQLTRPQTGEFMVSPITGTQQGQPIYLAVDKHGRRHLLVPTGEYRAIAISDGSALRVEGKTVTIRDAEYSSFLDIQCTKPEFNDTFDHLLVDVITRLERSGQPADDALQCLEDWRAMFRISARRTLSPSQRIGLFAELGALQDLLRVGLVTDSACWTGPSMAPHDFELSQCSLEVKAHGNASELVTFHGINQLDTHDNKPLFLCLRQIEEDSSGKSLIELAQEIGKQLSDPTTFRDTLNKMGVLDGDLQLNAFRYAVTHESIIEVAESTPKIIASSFARGQLPDGVELVRYAIPPAKLISGEVHATIQEWEAKTWK